MTDLPFRKLSRGKDSREFSMECEAEVELFCQIHVTSCRQVGCFGQDRRRSGVLGQGSLWVHSGSAFVHLRGKKCLTSR